MPTDANNSGTKLIQQIQLTQVERLKQRRDGMIDFLTNCPPGKEVTLLCESQLAAGKDQEIRHFVEFPPIQVHCVICGHNTNHEPVDRHLQFKGHLDDVMATYRCRNCVHSARVYAIRFLAPDGGQVLTASKYGQYPNFGERVPDNLLKLFGRERDYFLKGRQSENHNLGIAALTYYRRVIEAKKDALFDEIIKVAKLLKGPDDLIKQLEGAKRETQFTKAVESIKIAVPEALLINGYNPLTLLHNALSNGIHGHTDAECLLLATQVRTILTRFVELLEQALTTNDDITSAVAALIKTKSPVSRTDDSGRPQ